MCTNASPYVLSSSKTINNGLYFDIQLRYGAAYLLHNYAKIGLKWRWSSTFSATVYCQDQCVLKRSYVVTKISLYVDYSSCKFSIARYDLEVCGSNPVSLPENYIESCMAIESSNRVLINLR